MTWDPATQSRHRRSGKPSRLRWCGRLSGEAGRSTGLESAIAHFPATRAAAVFIAAVALCIGATFCAPTAAAVSEQTPWPVISARASSHRGAHPAALVIAGRSGTRWIAASCAYPQWIQVDLGRLRSIGALRIQWYRPAHRTYSFQVQTRNAGSWRRFVPGVRARYVRLRITGSSVMRSPASVRELTVLPWTASAQPATPDPPATPAAPQTIRHLVISGDSHDRVYDNVAFSGGGNGDPSSSGVIEINSGAYNITFVNCTIEANADGVGDGVKIMDAGGTIHDITFQNCHFLSQPRMGFECINRPGDKEAGYQHIDLIGCIFEPQGSEAISYDDDSPGAAGDCLLRANIIKGAGTNLAFPWGQALEINGPSNMTVSGNTFYAGRGDIWNLRRQTTSDCGWVFSDNKVDASMSVQAVPQDPEASCIAISGVYGGIFSGNVITSAAPGGGVAWMNDCHGLDWRTTTWRDVRGAIYFTPLQIDCSDNIF
jgi:hypothetical protein